MRTILPMIALLSLSGCSMQEVPMNPAPERIRIDGSMAEWDGASLRFFERQGVVVGTAADADYLYAVVRFRDPEIARALRMGGLTLWLNGRGNRSPAYGIRMVPDTPSRRTFPRAALPTLPDSTAAGDRPAPPPLPLPEVPEELLVLRAAGKGEPEGIVEGYRTWYVPSDGRRGVALAAGTDRDFYVYEARFPLSHQDIRPGLPVPAGREVGVGIEIEPPQRGLRPSIGMEGGGRTGGGMPGGRGGRGGMSGRGERPEAPAVKEIRLWIRTRLPDAPEGSRSLK